MTEGVPEKLPTIWDELASLPPLPRLPRSKSVFVVRQPSVVADNPRFRTLRDTAEDGSTPGYEASVNLERSEEDAR